MSEDSSAADFKLEHGSGTLTLPATAGTEAPSGMGIGKLLAETGYVTLDPGFVNTASCTSAITFIDGDAGILRYRGYPIEELAEKAIVPRGRVPADLRRAADRRAGAQLPGAHPRAHDAARGPQGVLRRLPARRAPDGGAVLGGQRAVDLLPGQPRPVRRRARRDLDRPPAGEAADDRGVRVQEVDRPAVPLPGQLPRLRRELPADDVRRPGEPYEVDPVVAKALDMLFVLHADHEQNCSTSTVRLVGSSHANLFASVSAGVNALFGPLHGGANQAVLEMLEQIRAGRRRRRRLRRAGQEQGARRQADGLRPPGLQELRPARRDREEGHPPRCSTGSASPTRCSTSR